MVTKRKSDKANFYLNLLLIWREILWLGQKRELKEKRKEERTQVRITHSGANQHSYINNIWTNAANVNDTKEH